MIRFTMPEGAMPQEDRKALLKEQLDGFLRADALRELLSVIGADQSSLPQMYGKRRKPSGGVMETQDMQRMPELEKHRDTLYPLFRELGFIDINTPRRRDHTRLLIYGGALGTCFDRTRCSARLLTERTVSVDALTCYRPINPVERTRSGTSSMADTEFGALTEAFRTVYGLDPSAWEDTFIGDRNLNSIACRRTYGYDTGNRAYRLFAAPSSQPQLRRADTGDCLSYYLRQDFPDETDSLLAITSNRYCNRQFIQTAYQLIHSGCRADFDIIGCLPDNCVSTADNYDPLQYLQDLIGILDWIERFSCEE